MRTRSGKMGQENSTRKSTRRTGAGSRDQQSVSSPPSGINAAANSITPPPVRGLQNDDNEVIDLTNESFDTQHRPREDNDDDDSIIDISMLPVTRPQPQLTRADRQQLSNVVIDGGHERGKVRVVPEGQNTTRNSGGEDVIFVDCVVSRSNRKRKNSAGDRENDKRKQGDCDLLLHCLVCLDEFQMIKNERNRRITATTCGHLFCNECIESAINQQGCCPACRTKLAKKSIRTIFM